MITATITRNKIAIDGHANYAPNGYDIVCSGVSALVGGVLAALEANEFDYNTSKSDGYIEISFDEIYINSPCSYIKEVLYHGLLNIQQQYPEHLSVVNSS